MDSYKRMRKATDFSDITLACEDGRQIYAHRIILASSSSFFQKVLTKVMHSHPLIFLKGVTHSHLSAIMDFIYLGQAEIQEKDVDAFVEVATDLGIKGITEQGTEAKERQAMRSVTPANAPADVDETDPGFKCDECEGSFSTRASLRAHKWRKNEKRKSSSQGRKGQEQVGKGGGVKTPEQNENAMMEDDNQPEEDHFEEGNMMMEKEGTGESSGRPVYPGGGSGEQLGSLGKPLSTCLHLYLGIAQIAITPPPPHSNGHSGALFSGAILPFLRLFLPFFYHFL